jgi:hypothetical protein
MKRRDLFGATLGFPLAAALVPESDARTKEAPAAMSSDEILYHVVYMFDRAAEDFRIPGIYTLKTDAEAHAQRLKESAAFKEHRISAVGTTLANHSWLQKHFLGERLGQLQNVLERLESRLE